MGFKICCSLDSGKSLSQLAKNDGRSGVRASIKRSKTVHKPESSIPMTQRLCYLVSVFAGTDHVPHPLNRTLGAWCELPGYLTEGRTGQLCYEYFVEKHTRNPPATTGPQQSRIVDSWSGITEESGKNKITCCLLYKQPHED